jgi:hypothetical protein
LSGAEVSVASAGGDAACPQSLVVGVAEAERIAGDELDYVVDPVARHPFALLPEQ